MGILERKKLSQMQARRKRDLCVARLCPDVATVICLRMKELNRAMIACRPISKLVEKALEGAETIRTLRTRLNRRYDDETFLGPAGVDLSRDVADLTRIISNLETMRSNLSQSV
jgi:hypothetical protein